MRGFTHDTVSGKWNEIRLSTDAEYPIKLFISITILSLHMGAARTFDVAVNFLHLSNDLKYKNNEDTSNVCSENDSFHS